MSANQVLNKRLNSSRRGYVCGTLRAVREPRASQPWQLRYISALKAAGIPASDIARAYELGPSPVGV